jgi:Tol biopolymer transport system component
VQGTCEERPSYFPDGKKIVYTGFGTKDAQIYTINAGGG